MKFPLFVVGLLILVAAPVNGAATARSALLSVRLRATNSAAVKASPVAESPQVLAPPVVADEPTSPPSAKPAEGAEGAEVAPLPPPPCQRGYWAWPDAPEPGLLDFAWRKRRWPSTRWPHRPTGPPEVHAAAERLRARASEDAAAAEPAHVPTPPPPVSAEHAREEFVRPTHALPTENDAEPTKTPKQANPANPTGVQIFVKWGSKGKTVAVDNAALRDSVLAFKEMLCAKLGVPVPHIRLLFGSKQLDDEMPLGMYGVYAASTLHCVYSLPGGMPDSSGAASQMSDAREYPTVPGEPVAMAFPVDDEDRVRRTAMTRYEKPARKGQGRGDSPGTSSTCDPESEEEVEGVLSGYSSAGSAWYPIGTLPPPPAPCFFDAANQRAVTIVQEVAMELLPERHFDGKCPKVVFIGSQSSGKTSLFTTMTKYPLPANEGMATRVPMSFSVEGGKVSANSLAVKRSSEKHWTQVPYDDPNALHGQILAFTNAMCAPGEINATEVIQVRLRRPTDATFAVVDVPGITCLSANLDTPNPHIEAETVALTKKMIGTEASTIVVVVLPATEDFANSKALSLIGDLGVAHRTIAVVTKIDNLAPGSNLKERMSTEFCDKYAKLGIFAVRNRTQLEADQCMPLDLLPQLEAKLFRENPALAELPEAQKGLQRLLDKLSTHQRRLMIERVPELKAEVHQQLLEKTDEMRQLPKPFADDEAKKAHIAEALREIEKSFEVCMKGGAGSLHFNEKSPAHLSYTVKVSLSAMQKDLLRKIPLFLDDATMVRITEAAKMQSGSELSVHDPNEAQQFQTEWATSVAHVLIDTAKVYPYEVATRVSACLDALVDCNEKLQSCDSEALCCAIKGKVHEAVDARWRSAQAWALDLAEVENEVGCRLTLNDGFIRKMITYDMWDKKMEGARGVYAGPTDLPEHFVKGVADTFAQPYEATRTTARRVQVALYYFNQIVQERFVDTLGSHLRKKIVSDTLRDVAKAAIELPRELAAHLPEYPAHAAERAQELKASIERLQSVIAKLNQV